MAKYQRIPEYIEAFQMSQEAQENTESWPEWAVNCAGLDNRKVGAIFQTDPEQSQNGFSIRTEYGVFAIPVNNWVVLQENSNYMIIQDDHFRAGFVEISKESEKTEEPKKVKNKGASDDPITDSPARAGKI